MTFSRLELLPPDVLDLSLSKLTYDELAHVICVSKTLSEGVELVVSSLAQRLGLSDHLDHIVARALALVEINEDSAAKFPKALDVVNSGRRSALEVRSSRSASAEWRWVISVHTQRAPTVELGQEQPRPDGSRGHSGPSHADASPELRRRHPHLHRRQRL